MKKSDYESREIGRGQNPTGNEIRFVFGDWVKEFGRKKPIEPKVKPICAVSGKRIYAAFSANQAIQNAVTNTGSRPTGRYYCHHCDSWHLTSKPLHIVRWRCRLVREIGREA